MAQRRDFALCGHDAAMVPRRISI
eukprot:SAG11_NODE_12494_length_700_cov_1.209651_1_plen_23_part_10